jgi:hypothetical protein
VAEGIAATGPVPSLSGMNAHGQIPGVPGRSPGTPRVALPAAFLVGFLILPGCDDSPSTPPGGDPRPIELRRDGADGARLLIRGGNEASLIRVTVDGSGVDVEVGSEREQFGEPVRTIEIDTGDGQNTVRFLQLVPVPLTLRIRGGSGADDVEVAFEPVSGGASPDPVEIDVEVDAGSGADRVDVRWNSTQAPALMADLKLVVEAEPLPEVADEVLVTFASGDPDRPVITGMVWNPVGTGAGAQADARLLEMAVAIGPDHADVELHLTGGAGPDEVEVYADHGGVPLQQGRILVDVDLNEGDNRYSGDFIVGAGRPTVENRVRAGDGNNRASGLIAHELTHVVQQSAGVPAAVVLTTIDLGDGDNETVIRFGDGQHGAAPPVDSRVITTEYRTGSGTNTLEVAVDALGPVESTLELQPGPGWNGVVQDYALTTPQNPPPGAQVAPSQVKVIVFGAMGGGGGEGNGMDAFDLRIEDRPQEGGGKPKEIVVVGSRVRSGTMEMISARHDLAQWDETDWDFLHTPARRTLALADLVVDEALHVEVSASDEASHLVYLQDRITLGPEAAMSVALRGQAEGEGNGHMAILDGVSGGDFHFLAEGGAAKDLLAVLAVDLPSGPGSNALLEVLGGGGDDLLVLAIPDESDRREPEPHRIDGGAPAGAPATAVCHATAGVLLEGCGETGGIDPELLELLDRIFGEEFGDEWRRLVPPPATDR